MMERLKTAALRCYIGVRLFFAGRGTSRARRVHRKHQQLEICHERLRDERERFAANVNDMEAALRRAGG